MNEKDIITPTTKNKGDNDDLLGRIDEKIAQLEALRHEADAWKTSVNYDMSEEALNNKVWGEMNENELSMWDMMLLTDLCNNASESKIHYLVHLYNNRSKSLEPIEAHFVAKYAEKRGYTMFIDANGQTKFEEAQKIEVDDGIKELVQKINEQKTEKLKQQEGPIKRLVQSWFKRK